MKATEFPEVNVILAENQPEYEALPVWVRPDEETKGYFDKVTMCFELNDDERKQVQETGQLWFTVLQPKGVLFHPIMLSALKPEK